MGLILAFNAGAINAGGFLMLHQYTSHMTGFASEFADGLALGDARLILNAAGALIAFVTGSAVTAILVNWARQHRMRPIYAPPLLLEALLLLSFGVLGGTSALFTRMTPFAVPVTVLLLSFVMGLQNAMVSKTSGGVIRTTHMTGNITDFGMELGKALYWNRQGPERDELLVRHDRLRMRRAGSLIAMFIGGGYIGALGFQHVGYVCVIPFAAILLTLAVPPLYREFTDSTGPLQLRFKGLEGWEMKTQHQRNKDTDGHPARHD
jgi:uncharacterized membrane protein YoaK (UPF0700 family)